MGLTCCWQVNVELGGVSVQPPAEEEGEPLVPALGAAAGPGGRLSPRAPTDDEVEPSLFTDAVNWHTRSTCMRMLDEASRCLLSGEYAESTAAGTQLMDIACQA